MSAILALLLLFLSLHSCNARVFKVDHSNLHAKKFQHYLINKENDGKVKHVLSELGEQQKVKKVGNINNAEMGRREINVVIRDSSSSSSSSGSEKISFKVPQKKGGDEDKDFFVDYTPPRTHPPSHN